MIEPPRILQTAAQATAIVLITTPRNQIQMVMGPGLQELMAALQAQHIAPTGPWFTHHLRMQPDTFHFEIGVPIHQPVVPVGRVTNGELPATTVARTIYHGPYEGLHTAWGEFEEWIKEAGHASGPSLWETYLTDPASAPDPATYRTELTRPLVQ